jgi:hypothetical protein
LLTELWPVAVEIARLVRRFRREEVTPQRTFDFEHRLNELLREAGRRIVQWTLNRLETPEQIPLGLWHQGDWYRRKRKSPMRHLSCLFGTIRLHRYLFEPTEIRDHSLFPLSWQLGIIANSATPALADIVARSASDLTQRQLLDYLAQQHQVCWGVRRLRDVLTTVAQGMSEHRHHAQVDRLLTWLKEAAEGGGPSKVILSVGRDGIMLPMVASQKYKEAAAATVSIYNRWGKRLGTVYLGQMPEEYQRTISDQLTQLITDVLALWKGPMPRLVYVTDAGFHPTDYFRRVLSRMRHPRDGTKLTWEWIVDYYHACQYITKIAQSVFGPGRAAYAWSKKMRQWLKTKPRGVSRVLHSAGALRSIRGLISCEAEDDYESACHYLRNHASSMNYANYQQRKLPIGSGVTEAACKTIFTQRFKRSGMKWKLDGGASILSLRVLDLSGVWEQARTNMLTAMKAIYMKDLKRPASAYASYDNQAKAA